MENFEANNPNPEVDNLDTEANRRLGATVLSAANFEGRHKDIIESSFDKARRDGEKLPGKNNERRNYAYLSRLEKLIEKHGNDMEKRLWRASVKDDLLLKYENITDSYWEAKEQEHRDNGAGSIVLTEDLKHKYFEKERKIQAQSLERWANYLGDEHSPYPLWFKVYAWDGMTKMGKYDKEKGCYAVRNETTVAPYPNPDAEVLSGIFEVVNKYYGNNERKFYTKEGERDIELEKIVQSGNFAKIYNAIEHDIAPIIEPPEKAEDVRGKWVEYGLGEEDDIAMAARGTGWCIASSSVGRHYLGYDTYNEEEDDYYNASKFILFHLEDPSTGELSKNAVASIRLDTSGNVAEISGIKKGQALNDSLVDIVAEKVKTLPGGEKFLEAFADKQELIRLDHKMQNNEDLTKEELEFIYEINREIHTLDTYNICDPRISELHEKYNIEFAINAGIDINSLAPHFWELGEDNQYALIEHGADANIIASNLKREDDDDNYIGWIYKKYLSPLIEHGADVNHFLSIFDAYDIVENLDILIEHGANIDINNLISELGYEDIAKNLDTLIKHGADKNTLLSNISYGDIMENFSSFVELGADIDINDFVSRLHEEDIAENLDYLIEHGANIDMDKLASEFRNNHSIDDMSTQSILSLINHRFIERGANIDIDDLVNRLGWYGIVNNLDTLLEHGANLDSLSSELESSDYAKHLDTFIEHGANINDLVSKLDPIHIVQNLDTLLEHGANININNLASDLYDYVNEYTDILRAHGWQG